MEMVRLALEEEVSVAALIQQHDVNDNLLFKWIILSQREGQAYHPQTHLAEFSGELQADAYAGFNELYHNGLITEATCWAHARRKIRDVHLAALTEETLKRTGELYAIEAEMKGMLAEQRLAKRQQKAKPLLKSL